VSHVTIRDFVTWDTSPPTWTLLICDVGHVTSYLDTVDLWRGTRHLLFGHCWFVTWDTSPPTWALQNYCFFPQRQCFWRLYLDFGEAVGQQMAGARAFLQSRVGNWLFPFHWMFGAKFGAEFGGLQIHRTSEEQMSVNFTACKAANFR